MKNKQGKRKSRAISWLVLLVFFAAAILPQASLFAETETEPSSEATVETQQTEPTESEPVEEEMLYEDSADSWRYQDGAVNAEDNGQNVGSDSASSYRRSASMRVLGIDVSKWQGKIDWAKVKASGVKFAIIRCGYGSDNAKYDDAYFAYNVSECERLGIPYGVYLYSYADSVADAQSEANHALRLLKKSNCTLSYPIYYDLEDSVTQKTGKTTITNIANTFCSIMENNGYRAGIYANLNWWNNYLTSSSLDKYEKWVAQWNSSCTYGKAYSMWQYTSSGSVNGISGRVDMNYQVADIEMIDYDAPEGTCTISQAEDTGKILQVKDSSLEAGASLAISDKGDPVASSQKFEIINMGSKQYKIFAEHSGKALEVNGTAVQQNSWSGTTAQTWTFVDTKMGDGSCYLKSKMGVYLKVNDDGSLAATEDKDEAQQWILDLTEDRPVEDGIYTVASAKDTAKVWNIKSGSLENSGNAELNGANNTLPQQFSVKYVSNGYYKITAEHSNKVLDVSGASQGANANIQQYTSNGTNAQLWKFVDDGNGHYYIRSKLGTVVSLASDSTENGTNVNTAWMADQDQQKWLLQRVDPQPVADGTYVISSSKNALYTMTQSSGNTCINLYENIGQQKYTIAYVGGGYYKITNQATGKVLDVTSAKKTAGANLQEYAYNGTDAQLWRFIENSDGTYYIKSKLGTFVDLSSGKIAIKNNIWMYTYNNTAAQKWDLDSSRASQKENLIEDGTYTFGSGVKNGSVMDVTSGSLLDKANVQLYSSNNTSAQRFEVTYVGNGYYTIVSEKSGKSVDVASGSTKSGANLWQYTVNGTAAQKWKFIDAGNGYYYIKSAKGTVIDVKSAATKNGTNVQMYTLNATNAQKWKPIKSEYQPIADGDYVLKCSLNQSRVLDIAGKSNADGANIQLGRLEAGAESQQYTITYVDDGYGYYTIASKASGKSLDVASGSLKSGANLQQYAFGEPIVAGQMWKFIDAGNGYYYIRSKLGTTIDVSGANTAIGTNIQLYNMNGTGAQKWKVTQ